MARAQGPYKGLKQYHLQELLAEQEELVLSRSFLWHGALSPMQEYAVQGGADGLSTVTAESAIPRKGCCYRWMGAGRK